jgi:hypothetical protein
MPKATYEEIEETLLKINQNLQSLKSLGDDQYVNKKLLQQVTLLAKLVPIALLSLSRKDQSA